MKKLIRVKLSCPTCKRRGDWFDGPYGPFCSRRCKLIDLGKWFGEEHVISKPLQNEAADQAPANNHVPELPDGE